MSVRGLVGFLKLALAAALLLICGPALADKRVALVIGNSAYKSAPKLGNPVNDANLIGGMFKKAGFDTVDVRRTELSAKTRRAILGAEPSGPVAGFEFLELISLRARIEQHEIGNRIVELAQLLAEHRAKRWSHERRAREVAASEQVDGLKMLLRLRLH